APVGYEHLAPHAFARTFIERVGDHADDLDRQLRIRTTASSKKLPERALAFEEVVGEFLVDDCDSRLLAEVALPEVAPFDERNVHRFEITGRQRIHEGLLVLAVRVLV